MLAAINVLDVHLCDSKAVSSKDMVNVPSASIPLPWAAVCVYVLTLLSCALREPV